MTTRLRLDLADFIRELTERHTHREHYTIRRQGTWYGADHLTTVPPLLEQLWASDTPSAASEDGPRAGYTSKPAARLEALDCLHNVDREADWWLTHLGQSRRDRSTIAAVRQVHGLAPTLEPCDGKRQPGCCDRHELEHDVRRWWTQARIVTGWDSPAWKPDNTCPMCGERGTLRVNLAAQGGFCVECRETWDEQTIGLLADHIRGESEREREPKAERSPCACPWPKPIVADLKRLCPWCGSARCVHAVEQRPVRREDEAS